MKMQDLSGRVAVITGAPSGSGERAAETPKRLQQVAP